MRIVFGHNRFKLKSVDPSEIGLFGSEYSNIKFELFQKYGHLYWIPFVPLGKMWAIDKGDQHKYVCHPDIEEKLNQMVGRSSKVSIFAWTGFLLIIAGLIIFQIYEKVEQAKWQSIMEESHKKEVQERKDKVDDLSADSYLMFTTKPKGETQFGSTQIPLKVLRKENDKVLLGSYVEPTIENFSVSSNETFAKFIMGATIQDSFWVTKAVLKESVMPEYDEQAAFKGIAISQYYKDGVLMLNSVRNMAGPLIKENMDAAGKTATYFELINNGFDAIADSIISEAGADCKISKNRQFKNGDTIAVMLSEQGNYILYCSDKQKRIYKYQLQNMGYLQIEQVFD